MSYTESHSGKEKLFIFHEHLQVDQIDVVTAALGTVSTLSDEVINPADFTMTRSRQGLLFPERVPNLVVVGTSEESVSIPNDLHIRQDRSFLGFGGSVKVINIDGEVKTHGFSVCIRKGIDQAGQSGHCAVILQSSMSTNNTINTPSFNRVIPLHVSQNSTGVMVTTMEKVSVGARFIQGGNVINSDTSGFTMVNNSDRGFEIPNATRDHVFDQPSVTIVCLSRQAGINVPVTGQELLVLFYNPSMLS